MTTDNAKVTLTCVACEMKARAKGRTTQLALGAIAKRGWLRRTDDLYVCAGCAHNPAAKRMLPREGQTYYEQENLAHDKHVAEALTMAEQRTKDRHGDGIAIRKRDGAHYGQLRGMRIAELRQRQRLNVATEAESIELRDLTAPRT